MSGLDVRAARCVVGLALGLAVAAAGAATNKPEPIRYNRDIRPVLSDKCFLCHGPDPSHRKAGLRLDVRESAIKHEAIVPGKPDDSELVYRITTDDKYDHMPPRKSHKTLTDRQKQLLTRWVAEGGIYEGHWAYLPPKQPAANMPTGPAGIDYFIDRRLARDGLKRNPEADRRTLIRRLHFDLVGLGPKPDRVEAFCRDKDPKAYEKLVDELLASGHYGERMAIPWLDTVRFADTVGYHSDNPRNVWPYRDYVIRAFNENKPFDKFTIEQLAGDLLPGSTREQKVASCFNRLLLTTEEGGAQPKDYEARMLADRVRAVGTVWLGQTFGCAQCHDHKYDPITQRDFYSMGAFFADINEPILGRREPGLALPTNQQQTELDRLNREIAEQTKELKQIAERDKARAKAAAKTPPAKAQPAKPVKPAKKKGKKRGKPKPPPPSPAYKAAKARLDQAVKARKALEAKIPRCLVSSARAKPRVVRLLPRGNWMDESGPILQPALPAYLPQPKRDGDKGDKKNAARRLTRLDLARWLVGKDNPLTGRVFVNRVWRQFFGEALVRSTEDLGAQGDWPTHPDLLDALAREFVDSGWDVKKLVRTIVLSRTYRQSSRVSPELRKADPGNRLLAHQSRFRLPAELVRDNALAISGLLVETIGGPSVKPYQPAGYWENLNFPRRTYKADTGPNQYRRGLYTWWQRSFLHPSLLAFDAPSRMECVTRRPRSNIPQQALVLLNDPTYVEAARAFAARILTEGGRNTDARLVWAWREALDRPPRDDEVQVARAVLAAHLAEYANDAKAAKALLGVGQSKPPPDLKPAELAGWTSVARILLNLHETITRN